MLVFFPRLVGSSYEACAKAFFWGAWKASGQSCHEGMSGYAPLRVGPTINHGDLECVGEFHGFSCAKGILQCEVGTGLILEKLLCDPKETHECRADTGL